MTQEPHKSKSNSRHLIAGQQTRPKKKQYDLTESPVT